MVGISLNNSKTAGDKATLLQTKDVTIIRMKDESDEELIPDTDDISHEQCSILFVCVIVLFVTGCLTTGVWFSSEFIGKINHKFYYPCHSRGQLNDRFFAHSNHLIPFTRPKKPVVFASTALNIVQGEVQQKVITDWKNVREIKDILPINLKNSARFIKSIDYNITIIHDYDRSQCYIIPFALQRMQKPSNIFKDIISALAFGPIRYTKDASPKTTKFRMPALTENELAQYGPEVISACPVGIQTFLVVPKKRPKK